MERSKQLNESRLKVLQAREDAVQVWVGSTARSLGPRRLACLLSHPCLSMGRYKVSLTRVHSLRPFPITNRPC